MAFAPLAFALLLCGAALAQTPPAEPQKLNFPPSRDFNMQHLKLELEVDLARKHIDSIATLQMTSIAPTRSVTLDAVDFDVRGVRAAVGDAVPAPVRFSNSSRELQVFFDAEVKPGEKVTVIVDYGITNPRSGLHFFAPSEETPDAPYQVWSQGQAEHHRHWMPIFDNPRGMQTSELIATVDSRFKVLSNGALVATRPSGDGKVTYHWLQDQPHVAYLITLVVGDFAVKSETWRGRPVLYYVPPDRVEDIERSFGNTTRMLDFFSDRIGVEYPWVKYAQVCCHNFGGGMENTSATTLGENTLHDERGHLDGDSDGLVAHELAHQWFGNLLTCRDWSHLWLNEGFATYFEAIWEEERNGADAFAYNMLNKANSAIEGGRTLPIVYRSYNSPDQQFDSRAYPKGAWVLHMLRCQVGDEAFWKIMNHYVTRHRHENVETVDLRRAIEHVTGRPWDRFFYDWTERPGCPNLTVTTSWNDADRLAEIVIRQTQESDPFEFPLTVELRSEDPSTPTRITRRITDRLTSIVVPLPSRPVMVRIDPGNTILKEITEEKSRELWVNQLFGDPDPIGRIRALRALARDRTDANRRELARALAEDAFWGVRVEAARSLETMTGDVARDALLVGARDARAQVRTASVSALAKFPGDETVRAALEQIVTTGDPSYRTEAAAITGLARVAPESALPRLLTVLDRKSPREVLRTAALRALGDQTDPAVLQVLTHWCGKQAPNEARQAAYEALAAAARKQLLQGAEMDAVVQTLIDGLGREHWRVRNAAVSALGSLGRGAAAALPELEKITASGAGERWTRSAREAIDRIVKDTPAQEQVADFARRLDAMKRENETLRERLDKLEGRMRAEAEHTGSHDPSN